jgi:PTH1 family peptidyl-tRNA hydrolase
VKVICGLGNPGAEYARTRHNVGWWVVDAVREAWEFPVFRPADDTKATAGDIDGERVLLVKPWTYMNRSGAALTPLLGVPDFEPARDLLVVVDDAALDVGRVRVRASGSSGGHNGLKSVEAALGTRDYARMRIGIGAPPSDVDLVDWVLAPFDESEEKRIIDSLGALVDAALTWIGEGAEAAANRFNQ